MFKNIKSRYTLLRQHIIAQLLYFNIYTVKVKNK